MDRGTKVVFFFLFPALLFFTGCGRKGEPAAHRPDSALYTAIYDRSVPPAYIDVRKAMAAPSAVRLSEIATEIRYFAVGDQTFPVTQVIAVPEGFITFNKPRIFLCRDEQPRKRIGFKALWKYWGNTFGNRNLYYDKATTRLYLAMQQPGEDGAGDRWYIGELPPSDSLLSRQRFLSPDSIDRRYYLNTGEELFAFTSEGYILRHLDPNTQVPTGITTFNLKGDTLCRFDAGVNIPSDARSGDFPTAYWYNDLFTFRLSFSDTVYRLADRQTIAPVYKIGLGEELQGRARLVSLAENGKGFFLTTHEGSNSPDILPTRHRLVYLKEKGETVALPARSAGLHNDLDDGLPFWPDGQTDEWLYMIRHVTELLDEIDENPSPRYGKLRDYLAGLPQNRYVLILVR